MIIHNMEQGSPAWIAARLGIPTSSNFDKILTPKTMKLSASAKPYAYYLAAEKLLNRQLENLDNLEWIAHGKMIEPEAIKAYEFLQDVTIERVGFVTSDNGLIGASPDGIIKGVSAGIECKCPAPQTQIGYLIDGFGDAYKVQVQGQMLVCEFEYVDRWAWHPEMPPVLQRTYRDEPFITALKSALDQFCDDLAAIIAKVKSSGMFEERASVLTSHDAAYSIAA